MSWTSVIFQRSSASNNTLSTPHKYIHPQNSAWGRPAASSSTPHTLAPSRSLHYRRADDNRTWGLIPTGSETVSIYKPSAWWRLELDWPPVLTLRTLAHTSVARNTQTLLLFQQTPLPPKNGSVLDFLLHAVLLSSVFHVIERIKSASAQPLYSAKSRVPAPLSHSLLGLSGLHW
jgi:hypothetical protein